MFKQTILSRDQLSIIFHSTVWPVTIESWMQPSSPLSPWQRQRRCRKRVLNLWTSPSPSGWFRRTAKRDGFNSLMSTTRLLQRPRSAFKVRWLRWCSSCWTPIITTWRSTWGPRASSCPEPLKPRVVRTTILEDRTSPSSIGKVVSYHSHWSELLLELSSRYNHQRPESMLYQFTS